MTIVSPNTYASYRGNGWLKCRSVQITGAGTSTSLEFSVVVPSSNILPDASDLRAALTDGTVCPVMVFSITGTTTKTVDCVVTFPSAPVDNSYIFFYSANATPTWDLTTFSLYDRFRTSALVSPTGWSTTGGYNEDDIIYVASLGLYVQVWNQYNGVTPQNIYIRSASTVAGLATATDYELTYSGGNAFVSYMYPSIQYYNGTWYLSCSWKNAGIWYLVMFINSNLTGDYTYTSELASGFVGQTLRVGPDGNFYLAAWAGGTPAVFHLLKSSSIAGEYSYSDMGDVFSTIGRSGWQIAGSNNKFEYDCNIGFYQGRAYVLFDCYGKDNLQKTAMAEINLTTGKAITNGVVLVDNKSPLVGQPCFMDDGTNPPYVFFANGIAKSYLQATTPPNFGRLLSDVSRIRFTDDFDFATGQTGTLLDAATSDASGLHIANGATGSITHWADGPNVGNFTIKLIFTQTQTPAVQATLFFAANKVGVVYGLGDPAIIVIINASGYMGTYLDNFGYTRLGIVGTHSVATGAHVAIIKRVGSAVTVTVDGVADGSGSFTPAIPITSVTLGSYHGLSQTSGTYYGFNGTIAPGSSFTGTALSSQSGAQSDEEDITPPSISSQPSGATIAVGATLSMSVTASGGSNLTYQWWKGASSISGATSATYSKTNAQTGDSGSYACVVTSDGGTITSSTAVVSVLNPPAITVQPSNQTLNLGQTISLSTTATGAGTLSYQWYKGATPVGTNANTFTKTNAQTGDAGSYTCVVTNVVGTITTNAATVTVNAPPIITVQPVSQSLAVGGTISESITATGATSYQWKKNTVAIGGATSAIYTKANAQVEDSGSYACDAINAQGTTTSTAATVSVATAKRRGGHGMGIGIRIGL